MKRIKTQADDWCLVGMQNACVSKNKFGRQEFPNKKSASFTNIGILSHVVHVLVALEYPVRNKYVPVHNQGGLKKPQCMWKYLRDFLKKMVVCRCIIFEMLDKKQAFVRTNLRR